MQSSKSPREPDVPLPTEKAKRTTMTIGLVGAVLAGIRCLTEGRKRRRARLIRRSARTAVSVGDYGRAPVVFRAHGLPIRQTTDLSYDALLHLGPGAVWLPALIAGAVLSYRGLGRIGGRRSEETVTPSDEARNRADRTWVSVTELALTAIPAVRPYSGLGLT